MSRGPDIDDDVELAIGLPVPAGLVDVEAVGVLYPQRNRRGITVLAQVTGPPGTEVTLNHRARLGGQWVTFATDVIPAGGQAHLAYIEGYLAEYSPSVTPNVAVETSISIRAAGVG